MRGKLLVVLAFLMTLAVCVPFINDHAEISRFGRAIDSLVPGSSIASVIARLGQPEQRWDTGLTCISCYPCTLGKARGPVLFYRRGVGGCGFDVGWYLYFDAEGRLLEVESSTT